MFEPGSKRQGQERIAATSSSWQCTSPMQAPRAWDLCPSQQDIPQCSNNASDMVLGVTNLRLELLELGLLLGLVLLDLLGGLGTRVLELLDTVWGQRLLVL